MSLQTRLRAVREGIEEGAVWRTKTGRPFTATTNGQMISLNIETASASHQISWAALEDLFERAERASASAPLPVRAFEGHGAASYAWAFYYDERARMHGEKGVPWTAREVDLVIDAYLTMLKLQQRKQEFNKSAIRRALQPKLNERSEAAIEYKLRNISYVLDESGLEYVQGYRPAENLQALLRERVEWMLEKTDAIHEPEGEVPPRLAAAIQPPQKRGPRTAAEGSGRIAKGVNFVDVSARNAAIGARAEDLVVAWEKERLRQESRDDLAKKVERVSQTIGDGLGYDVLSFDENGTELHIEVKGTASGTTAPFFMSPTELRAAEVDSGYELHRVVGVGSIPKFWTWSGPEVLALSREPSEFRILP